MHSYNAHNECVCEGVMSVQVSSSKKATNLSLSADVLVEARALGINLSQVCDDYLRGLIREERARRWRDEHADFFAEYNKVVEQEGLPLDEWRAF